MKQLSRTPPPNIRLTLRQEVAWGCPIPDCGNPYLEYHHFDPPWAVEHHHDPARMIALCATHHAKAEAWTVDDVRCIKRDAPNRPEVKGRFEWMRKDILAIVGGNYYYETPRIIEYCGKPVVWFERDDDHRLLLSLRMLTASGEPRAYLDRNDWITRGNPRNVDSPPKGRTLRVQYANGDDLRIEFKEWPSLEDLGAIHKRPIEVLGSALKFPLITAEVTMDVGGFDVKVAKGITIIRGISYSGNVSSHSYAGLSF